MTSVRFRNGWFRRPAADPSDRGSMPMALLVTLVGMALSAALVPIVVSQVTSTRTVSGRTLALQAAQAGIDVAVGQLRVAIDGTGAGDLEALPPCAMSGTARSGSGYRVTIVYYRLPADDAAEPEPQDCPPTDVPVTAKLSSTGGPAADAPAATRLTAGAAGTRTIEATYTFKTSNQNISGGAIQLAAPTTDPLCLDGGPDASPAPGTVVKMQLCKTGGSRNQRFAYTTDLNIKLVGSETAGAPAGMCLDAAYPRTTGDAVRFQPCLGLVPRQQWSLNDSSNFSSTRETEPVLGDFCLNLRVPGTADQDIVLGSCGGGADQRIFRPQPGVGAGMSSADTGQLVNFKQFSRCLDVTNFKPSWSYMIVWFCKQAPDGKVPWNQHWTYPPAVVSQAQAVPERIRAVDITDNNAGYCLRSPGSTAADQYVTMVACDATGTLTDPNLKWVIYGDTGDYATSYRIVDSFGYCLTPTDLKATPPDTHGDGTAKVKVATCNKSELQKWNAPADLNQPLALTNTREK